MPSPYRRQELVELGSDLVSYLHDERVRNVFFVDRSARPLYLVMRYSWRQHFGKEPIPHIYFINPTGLHERETTSSARIEDILLDCKMKDNPLHATPLRSRAQIIANVRHTYRRAYA